MKERTFSINKANIINIPFIIITFTIIGFLYYCRVDDYAKEIEEMNGFLVIALLFGGMIVHELIHGFFFARYAPSKMNAISFGVKWKALALYCRCSESIIVQKYRISILMPVLLLGFTPTTLGLILGDVHMTIWGAVMIVGGIGDFISLWMLKGMKRHTMVLDHPNTIGFLYEDSEIVDSGELKSVI